MVWERAHVLPTLHIVRATGAKPAPLEAQGKRSKPVNYSEAHTLTFHRGYSLSYWNRKSTDTYTIFKYK